MTKITFYSHKADLYKKAQQAVQEILKFEASAPCPDEEEIQGLESALKFLDDTGSAVEEMADLEVKK